MFENIVDNFSNLITKMSLFASLAKKEDRDRVYQIVAEVESIGINMIQEARHLHELCTEYDSLTEVK